MSLRRLGLLALLALLAAYPGLAQIEEEDLPIDEASGWSLRLDEARDVFASPEQLDAIPLLGTLIEELEAERVAGRLDEAARRVLVESLALRAEAAFNLGDQARAELDLDRLVVLDPSFVADRDLVSPKFWNLFERMRGRHVGDVELTLDPADARAYLDGEPLPPYAASAAVLAGSYRLRVERPGYRPVERDFQVRAGRRNPVELTLERSGAVISLVTRPVGVRVRLDGIERGATEGSAPPDLLPVGEAARYPRSEFSDRLLVGDLLPGPHEVELFLEGFRSELLEVLIEEDVDYDLGVHVLERSRGVLRLVGLPAGAAVRVDGLAALPDRRFSGAPALTVAPGAHQIEVEHGAEGVFQAAVRVADGQTVDLEVSLRPALALLGVLGAEGALGDRLADLLERVLDEEAGWTLFDARDRIGQIEGFTAESLARLYPLSFPDAVLGDWRGLQEAAARSVPASVLALAVVGRDGSSHLWLLPASPAPPLPQVWGASAEDLSELAAALVAPREPEPWLGMVLVDVNGPMVLTVDAGSPAAEAGLEAGDRVMAVGGRAVVTAAQARQLVRGMESVQIEVTGPAGRRTVALKPRKTWHVPSPNSPGLLRAALYRELPAAAPDWLAPWLRAVALLDAGLWEEAQPGLALVRAPQAESPGQDALTYQQAMALLAAATGGRDKATNLLGGLTQAKGRLGQPDGLPVAPLARLRLDALQGK